MPDRMPGGADPYGAYEFSIGVPVRYVQHPDCSKADRDALKRLGYTVLDAVTMPAPDVGYDPPPATGPRKPWD